MVAHSCSICGTGFGVPTDEELVPYIEAFNYQKPIADDDVLWLSRFRILGRYGSQHINSTELRLPNGGNEDAQLGPCFLTGSGRFRRSKAEFLRGEMVGLSFGEECSSVNGEGADELLCMPESSLWKFVEDRPRHEEVHVVHQACYDGILGRVIDYAKRGKSVQHKADQITLIKLHDGLLRQRIMGDESNFNMYSLTTGDPNVFVEPPGMKCLSIMNIVNLKILTSNTESNKLLSSRLPGAIQSRTIGFLGTHSTTHLC